MRFKLRGKRLLGERVAGNNVATLEGQASQPGTSATIQRPMHRMFLNADIIILICVSLDTTLERLSLYATSRWCSVVLKNAIYTSTILRPDGPTFGLLSTLLREQSRCSGIRHLDVWLSLRSALYVPGRDDLQQLWRQREEFVHGVQTVLERAPNLETLYIKSEHDEDSLAHDLSLEGRQVPFKLKSCRLAGLVLGGLEFIDSQPGITRLVLAEKSEQHPAPLPDWTQGFTESNNLRLLWSTPGWARTLLIRSPVRTFGLIRDSRKIPIGWGWNGDMVIFDRMAETFAGMGGHPTVKCLALPAREYFFMDTLMELKTVSDGFPRVEKLGITLEPREYNNVDGTLLNCIQAQIDYAGREGPIFQSVREFSLLLPGTWPHEPFGTGSPCAIESLGLNDDIDFTIPVELLKIMPRLVHVDTVQRCYSRAGAGSSGCDPFQVFGPGVEKGEWNGGVRSLDHVWFGRPRSECCLSEDWSQF